MIDLHLTKIQNAQLQSQNLKTQYDNGMHQLQDAFNTESTAYNKAVEDARESLKLSKDYQFNPKTFSFDYQTKAPATKVENKLPTAPVKK